jgi:hypothetical protein
MLTNSGNFGDLGWGWKSLNPVNVVKKTVIAPTKFLAKKTLVEPAKIVGKSAVGVAKNTAAVGTNVAQGKFKAAAKSAGRVALAPGKLAYDTTKHAAKTGVAVSKAVTDIALAPLRGKLNTLKTRRAKKLAWDRRKSTAPTTAESAQARKDVKAMLSSKGPHGKMMAWLAGGPMFAGELGVVGYDDAAIAAIATALTATAVKIIQDAAKSKFAPADAAKEGAAAGAGVAVTAALAPVEKYTAAAKAFVEPEAEAAAPVTQEEVAAEPEVAAEEETVAAETEEMEGALASAGLLGGFLSATEDALAPATMEERTAKRIASAAQRMVCGMSAPALNAIGGLNAINAARTLCQAVAAGDEATVRAALPAVVQIAARASNAFAVRSMQMGMRKEGGLPNEGFGDAMLGALRGRKARRPLSAFDTCVRFQMNELEASRSDAEYACQDELRGMNLDEIGALAAFDGADFGGLSFALAGVTPDDLAASSDAANISMIMLGSTALIAALGFYLALKE